MEIKLGKSKTHLAICTEPFLSLMLSGQKKVESRFSKNKIAPYKKVSKGDVIMLKRSGGEIVASTSVKQVVFAEIKSKEDLEELKKKYSRLICADIDPDFWQKKVFARYASFVWLGEIKFLKNVSIKKAGRSGWRILE